MRLGMHGIDLILVRDGGSIPPISTKPITNIKMITKNKPKTKNETALLRNSVIAYTRKELNQDLEKLLGKPVRVNQAQWDMVADLIHSDNYAWSYMDDAINKAIGEMADSLK